jgi:hypothetical protein
MIDLDRWMKPAAAKTGRLAGKLKKGSFLPYPVNRASG